MLKNQLQYQPKSPKKIPVTAMEWTDEAKTLFKKIPFFVRPFAKGKIEKLAQDMGATVIDEEIYIQAKAQFNDPSKSGD